MYRYSKIKIEFQILFVHGSVSSISPGQLVRTLQETNPENEKAILSDQKSVKALEVVTPAGCVSCTSILKTL